MPKNKDGYFRSTFVIGKTADGKPERVTVRAKTKRELDEKLAEAKRLYARGLDLGDITVYDWSYKWLKVYKANATETQKNHYKTKLNSDILPVIGSMRMRDVRASHLQELLNTYAGGKVGTVQKIRIAIKQLFEDAENEGIIERSPAVRLELPDLTELSRRPLTALERAVTFEVAQNHKCGVYVLTMLFCGLRRGECIALLVKDIDFEKQCVHINKSLDLKKNVGEISNTKAAKLRKKIKNDESLGVREAPLPDILIPFLTAQCNGKNPDDILFVSVK